MKIYNCSKPILSRFSSINSFLGIVILLFGIFDTARNYTLLPIWFGYIKDIAKQVRLKENVSCLL